MHVTYYMEEAPTVISTQDMAIGETVYGRIGEARGTFLKTFGHRLVMLDDPSRTWVFTKTTGHQEIEDARRVEVEVIVR